MDRNSPGMNIISFTTVALRKESVDRNKGGHRARHRLCVALRKESVDRNRMVGTQSKLGKSRSPQGERG